MKYLPSFYFILLVIGFSSCSAKNSSETNKPEENISSAMEEGLPIQDNSMTSLDWDGTYSGIVPCADCSGIETTLTLNLDRTFTIITNYLGRNDALEETFNGNFRWDESGSKVILEGVQFAPNQFKVGENKIWQLDRSGNMITGDLADHYILFKKP
ncbi:copper resistance protein NlpE N-terminal domain-containing protein [Algoriphagus aestuarii]|nr:copper resistance protein NlpE N-terminal domain-containing protein [Algoriphagus aestuarii]